MVNFALGARVKESEETALATVAPETPLSQRVAEKAVDHLLPNATPEARALATHALAPWAEKLVRVLDDAIRVPGTSFGIGLDAIVGMVIPGAGDFLTSIGSLSLLFLALREKVPTVVILRMVMNILIDTVGGVVPIVGDVFDVFWKSNRKNLDLIKKYRNDPNAKPSTADYALVTVGGLLSIAGFVIPLVLFFVFGTGALVGLGTLFSSCGGTPPPAH